MQKRRRSTEGKSALQKSGTTRKRNTMYDTPEGCELTSPNDEDTHDMHCFGVCSAQDVQEGKVTSDKKTLRECKSVFGLVHNTIPETRQDASSGKKKGQSLDFYSSDPAQSDQSHLSRLFSPANAVCSEEIPYEDYLPMHVAMPRVKSSEEAQNHQDAPPVVEEEEEEEYVFVDFTSRQI